MILIITDHIAGLWGSFSAGMLNIKTLTIGKDIFQNIDNLNYIQANLNLNNFFLQLQEQFLQFANDYFIVEDNKQKKLILQGKFYKNILNFQKDNNNIKFYDKKNIYDIKNIIIINKTNKSVEELLIITKIPEHINVYYINGENNFIQIAQEIANTMGIIYNKNSQNLNINLLPHSTTTGEKLLKY